jgi:hypothetical protein
LKGKIRRGAAIFFINNYAPGIVQNGNFEWLKVGDSRVFFLMTEGGRLRSVSDLYATSIEFPHATMPAVFRTEGEPVGEGIARLLLSRGLGEPPQTFVRMLPRVTTEALKSAGYPFVSSLLGHLATTEIPEVELEACLTAYEQVLGGDQCLPAEEDSNIAPEISQRIRTARQRRAYLHQLAEQVPSEGSDCPLLHYTYGVEPGDPVSVIGFLKFLAQQPDPAFRACAMRQLHELTAPVAQ